MQSELLLVDRQEETIVQELNSLLSFLKFLTLSITLSWFYLFIYFFALFESYAV